MTNEKAIERLELLRQKVDEETYRALIMGIKALERERQGHWIEIEQYSDGKHKIKCSECGNYIFDRGHANSHNVKEKYKYCNDCGAKMSE